MYFTTFNSLTVTLLAARAMAGPLYPVINNTLLSPPTLTSLPSCPPFSNNGGAISTREVADVFKTATITADVSLLADRELIRTTLSRYALAANSHDVKIFDHVFTHDAHANFFTFGVMNGVDEIKTGLGGVVSNFVGSQHQVGTSSIQLCVEKGDHGGHEAEQKEELSAISVTYTSAVQFPMADTVPLNVPIVELVLVYAQYQDQWKREVSGKGVVG